METIKINVDDIKTHDFIKISQGVKLINEDLGIKRPEEIETWSTLFFDVTCLESCFIQSDSNICLLFKSGESFVSENTPELLSKIEKHFGL